MEGLPGICFDLGLQSRLQNLMGIIGTKEVGVPKEEALLVVIGID